MALVLFVEYADWPLLALAAGLGGLFALVVLTWRSFKWRSRPSLPELLSLPLAVAAAAAVQVLVELLPGEGIPSVIGASAATGASLGAADYGVRRRSMRTARSAGLLTIDATPQSYVRLRLEPVDNRQSAGSHARLAELLQQGRVIGVRQTYWLPDRSIIRRMLARVRPPRSAWMTIELTKFNTAAQAKSSMLVNESHTLRAWTARNELGLRRRQHQEESIRRDLTIARWQWDGRELRNSVGDTFGREDDTTLFEARLTVRTILVEVSGDVERDVRQAAFRIRGALEAQSQEIDVPNLSPALR